MPTTWAQKQKVVSTSHVPALPAEARGNCRKLEKTGGHNAQLHKISLATLAGASHLAAARGYLAGAGVCVCGSWRAGGATGLADASFFELPAEVG